MLFKSTDWKIRRGDIGNQQSRHVNSRSKGLDASRSFAAHCLCRLERVALSLVCLYNGITTDAQMHMRELHLTLSTLLLT
jgi:hypothetical protein